LGARRHAGRPRFGQTQPLASRARAVLAQALALPPNPQPHPPAAAAAGPSPSPLPSGAGGPLARAANATRGAFGAIAAAPGKAHNATRGALGYNATTPQKGSAARASPAPRRLQANATRAGNTSRPAYGAAAPAKAHNATRGAAAHNATAAAAKKGGAARASPAPRRLQANATRAGNASRGAYGAAPGKKHNATLAGGHNATAAAHKKGGAAHS
jgi:hypothetical protein